MTVSMPQIQTIRQSRKEGETVAGISRSVGLSRDTVYKRLGQKGFSPKMPVKDPPKSIMDEHRPIIEGHFGEDALVWRKRRRAGRRIYERLRDERGCTASESTVRHYGCRLRKEIARSDDAYLTLAWAPGEAQADFGEADSYVMGVRERLSSMVVTLPFSSVGIAQLFGGQNAECACQGLKSVFEFSEGVPTRIVFDNAAGVGRKVADGFRTTELFGAFAARYGFAFSFCNPASGNEKGTVENKVDSSGGTCSRPSSRRSGWSLTAGA